MSYGLIKVQSVRSDTTLRTAATTASVARSLRVASASTQRLALRPARRSFAMSAAAAAPTSAVATDAVSSTSPPAVAAVAPAVTGAASTAAQSVTSLPSFSLVVAATQSGGIGQAGGLPWPAGSMPEDMKRFRTVTSSAPVDGQRNVVIMGRRTWTSIPAAHRPLRGRINIVLSRSGEAKLRDELAGCENTHVATSLIDALALARTLPGACTDDGGIFVIGGSALFDEALRSPLCHTVYLTRILTEFDTDTHIPPIDSSPAGSWRMEPPGPVSTSATGIPYQFQTLQRRVKSHEPGNEEEEQYLQLVRRVIESGVQKGDRTGTGTLSLFGAQMRFSLRDGRFPLLTSKRVFWRGVVEELIWLIKGCTDSKALAEKKVHIWDDNGSRAFLDKLGFKEREEGDLGPVYGHQWRHFGAQYKDCKTDYTGSGVDQLAQVIHTIKTNPNDRRIIMSAWNPIDLPSMALPPCHVMCQFYVANGELSCQMYQRSCDLGLGIPFNIASYSLLTVMIAHVCGLRPGEFVHVLADAHVYLNHVDALKQQLERTPRPFPTLAIKRTVGSIDDFTFDDFQLHGYKPLDAIKMQMAV